jgi:hypothetical protein
MGLSAASTTDTPQWGGFGKRDDKRNEGRRVKIDRTQADAEHSLPL